MWVCVHAPVSSCALLGTSTVVGVVAARSQDQCLGNKGGRVWTDNQLGMLACTEAFRTKAFEIRNFWLDQVRFGG